MNVPARDDLSRLDLAQQRLANALNKLEGVLAKPVVVTSEQKPEDDERLVALREEVSALKQENADLEDANDVAVARIEETLSRLKSLLVA